MKFKSVTLFILSVLFSVAISEAQNQVAAEDTTVYKYVETKPKFPGGMPGLAQYFQQNLKYPESALYKRKEGRSIIEFIVNADGSISSVKTAKGFDEACDQEACRLISIMPAWNAGMNRGKVVRVKILLPIVFRLPLPEAVAAYRAPENQQNTNTSIEPLQMYGPMTGDNSIYSSVDEPPVFLGGPEAMNRFIQKNLKYPWREKRAEIQGKVFVEFIVNKDGTLSDFRSFNGISIECEREAQRIVTLMPPWVPGIQNGKPVRVKYVLPIDFKLPN